MKSGLNFGPNLGDILATFSVITSHDFRINFFSGIFSKFS